MIQSIEVILADVPTIRPHKLSVATMNTQTLVLVRVRCADGVEGWGEGTTIGGLNYGEESPESIKVNIDTHIAPLLIGMEATQVAKAMAKIRKVIQGNRFAKCAIETALLDAQSRRIGVPLSELLGGRVRDALPVAWTLASGDTAKDITEAQMMLELRRHRIFKLKIGARAVRDDVAHVLAIKKALGDSVSVRVGVNMAWSELEAVEGMAALEAGGIDLIEQPVRAENVGAMARLAQRYAVAVMADEALHGPQDAMTLANAGRPMSSRSRSRSRVAWCRPRRWPRWRSCRASRCTAARCWKGPSAPPPRRICFRPLAICRRARSCLGRCC